MAPKKRPTSPPLEDDHKPSTQKQPEDKLAHEEEEDEDDSSEAEEGSSSEEEGSSSEEEEEEKDQSQPASKNTQSSTPISNPNPKPASESESESGSESGSDSGSGTESETDSQPEPTPPPLNPKVVKPLASKPMKAQPKAQTQAQTQAQTYSILARSGTKRAAENGNDSNRSKKKTTALALTVTTGGDSNDENENGNETEEDVKLTGEDSKKSTQRLFSEEDELTILKGLADFISKTKKDPLKDALAFHSFVKKSLSAEASSAQLKRKVRTLKKKFETSDGFTKPHDKKAFELFKKVWGNTGANVAEENGKFNGKIAKGVKKEATGSVKKELVVSTKKEAVKVGSVVDNSLIVRELFRFGVVAGSSVLNKDAVERGLELIDEAKRVEFVEKWKQVQIAEMELLVRRSQLAKEQSNLVLQALKKSSK